jgi:ADP-ribosyl-[dinitrogen reductase] hydrolase
VGSNPTASARLYIRKKDMSKIATLVGCAIGDALGNPFEMKAAASPSLQEWDGLFKAGGTFWKGNPGQYTDDTLMSIALATSLIEWDGFYPEKVAKEYLAWYNTGNTRGIGTTTANAMVNLKFGVGWTESGLKIGFDGLPASGNGTAMRAAPLGLAYRHNLEKLMDCAMQDASITHNSLNPQMGSVAVSLGVALLANKVCTPQTVLAEVVEVLAESVVKDKMMLALNYLKDNASPQEALAGIGTSGYVPETVGAAFYCLSYTDNFKDSVVMAIKAGGDTDTTAAIVGAMAGTFYGLDLIPNEYKDNVENFELLTSLDQELINMDI